MRWHDFLFLGLAVVGAFVYGYLEGFRSGFIRGVRAMRRREEEGGAE